jgi:hypothetical protein
MQILKNSSHLLPLDFCKRCTRSFLNECFTIFLFNNILNLIIRMFFPRLQTLILLFAKVLFNYIVWGYVFLYMYFLNSDIFIYSYVHIIYIMLIWRKLNEKLGFYSDVFPIKSIYNLIQQTLFASSLLRIFPLFSHSTSQYNPFYVNHFFKTNKQYSIPRNVISKIEDEHDVSTVSINITLFHFNNWILNEAQYELSSGTKCKTNAYPITYYRVEW